MPVQKIIEKPGGARNVLQWDVHTDRSWELERVLVPDDGGGYHIEASYKDTPSLIQTHIVVKFWDDESARDFEAKVRAMLPEVEQ
jgi:hypothetical protein